MESSFLHGGVSRSGRIRKKPAKLMEMDLSTDERPMERTGGGSYVENKTAALSSALMGSSQPTSGRHSGLISPPSATTSRRQSSSSAATSVNFVPIVQRVQPPTPINPSSLTPALGDRGAEQQPTQAPPRVIAIKAMDTSPHFENLSGSTYLIGDDVHFITGEPVDSDPDHRQQQQHHDLADDEDEDDDIGHHRGYRLSPLKVDIGGHVIDETSRSAATASLAHGDEGDGLRMKFILSPKTSSSSSFDKVKGSQSKSKKSKKSSKSHSKKSSGFGSLDGGGSGNNSGSGGKSKKKKKKGKSADEDRPSTIADLSNTFHGMPVLEVLPTAKRSVRDRFHSADSDSDSVDGDSKLIIAEPPVLKPMVPIGKPKKKSGKSSSKSKKKSGGLLSKHHQEDQSDAPSAVPVTTTAESLGQQHSVYLKEKNASKKRSGKKVIKTKDKCEAEVAKARPMSAYMLWAREYRSHIVRANPGIDFATISRRLGEVWQSLSEFEKTSWRRKAKMSCMPTTTSNVINTGKKPTESAVKHGADGGRGVSANTTTGTGGGSGGGSSSSSKVLHRAPPPTVTTVNVQPTPDDPGSCGSPGATKPVGTTPLDVAAHLKLLGESLSIIGQRLTEHEGQIAVSGSLSVLLDSTLCALGPLMCLTSEVDNLDGAPKSTQERILDNIAYIMPGL